MGLKRVIRATINASGFDLVSLKQQKSPSLIRKPTDTSFVEVLLDEWFQKSVEEVKHLTILDTARLANLWQLCRWSNPEGAIIEIGSYRGGSALHLSNSCPQRQIFVCDTFEGFGALPMDARLDRLFKREDFVDTDLASVQRPWANKGRDVKWVKGYFPTSASTTDIRNLSFAHIDVDLYKSTIDTLEFLNTRFIDRSIIVFDDYLRNADGVMEAIREFELANPEWISFPLYPGQGVMFNASWFKAKNS